MNPPPVIVSVKLPVHPAVIWCGSSAVMVGTGTCSMASVSAFDVPPPGVGVTAVTVRIPALAIAAVTAVLKDLLNNGVINNDIASTVGEVAVTSLPPDRIDVSDGNERNQLNLFLYQVTPNAGWRNVGLPSRDSRGERISNPPLALDLHYMLSAYGTRDLHPEILLG